MKELSWEELDQYGKEAAASARKSAFNAGTFYCYGEGNKVIRVYPDGRKTESIWDGNGNHKKIKFDDSEK